MHSIETEVLDELNRSNDLLPAYVNLIKHSGVFNYPLNEDPVDFGKSSAIACAFSMIYETFHRSIDSLDALASLHSQLPHGQFFIF